MPSSPIASASRAARPTRTAPRSASTSSIRRSAGTDGRTFDVLRSTFGHTSRGRDPNVERRTSYVERFQFRLRRPFLIPTVLEPAAPPFTLPGMQPPSYPGAVEPERSGEVESLGLRLHYVEWGDPEAMPLVLCHGMFDHAR